MLLQTFSNTQGLSNEASDCNVDKYTSCFQQSASTVQKYHPGCSVPTNIPNFQWFTEDTFTVGNEGVHLLEPRLL